MVIIYGVEENKDKMAHAKLLKQILASWWLIRLERRLQTCFVRNIAGSSPDPTVTFYQYHLHCVA